VSSISTFLLHNLTAADVCGKVKKKKAVGDHVAVEFPCGVCGLLVSDAGKAVFCDVCELWQHADCEDLTAETITTYWLRTTTLLGLALLVSVAPYHSLSAPLVANHPNIPLPQFLLL